MRAGNEYSEEDSTMKAKFRVQILLVLLIVFALLALAPAVLAAGASQASPPITLTPDDLAKIVGAALALIFAYVPWIKDWFDKVGGDDNGKVKAALMGLLLILTAVAIFALSCGAVINVGITCDKAGALSLLVILLNALMANQGTFLLAVDPYKPKNKSKRLVSGNWASPATR
jgi:hypothetical protein